MKFTFSYGHHRSMTVTVKAKTRSEASMKAREVLDKRYEALGLEPPVAWTLRLDKIVRRQGVSETISQEV